MGRYYAQAQGEETRSRGPPSRIIPPPRPTDAVPKAPGHHRGGFGRQDRHADRLTGRFDEKPTGSKDPYALRRAALGGDPAPAR